MLSICGHSHCWALARQVAEAQSHAVSNFWSCTTRCRLHNLLLRFALDMGSTVPQERGAPPAKRKRIEKGVSNSSNSSNSSARLFAPFRALGLITNHVPFVLQTRSFKGATDGPRIHILTCLGSSWAMWEGGKMTLLFVGMSGTCFLIKGQFTKRMC